MHDNCFLRTLCRDLATAVVAATTFAIPAVAQDYPVKPIKIVVGFSPGGVTDAIPRLLAEPMSVRLGQPVVVENKTGAGGAISVAFVAQAAPDGYTLLGGGVGQIVVAPHTSKMSTDPSKELAHISLIGEGDQVFSINPDVPAKNYAEFVAYVKQNPGKVFYGDAGAGGNMHLYIEYFKMLAGLDIKPIHYRGGGHIMPDLLSNRVQISLNTWPVIKGHVAEGKLRPILVIGEKRHPELPDVPTVAEVGLKDLEVASNWFSLHAPKGTPPAVLKKIHTALVESLNTDAVKTGLKTLDIRAVGDTPEHFASRIARDYETFGEIARKTGVHD